ncbi:MAG: alpha/beta hydrolase fold domain-containing protein, partial [Acidobacteriota bacterium]
GVVGGRGPPATAFAAAEQILWQIDSIERIGNLPVIVVGTPRVVDTEHGKAVEFNGASDGLFIDGNPLEGLDRFTIEVLFEPAVDGAEEQRFLHFEETGSGNRALVELRRLPDGRWTLDTFLRHGQASLTLIDRTRTHPSGSWHVAAMTFDGKVMSHYVDGVLEGRGEVAFKPLWHGRTSIGVRQNRVSWFKGRIRTIRITTDVLPSSAFLQVNPESGSRRVIPLWPEGVPGEQPAGGQEYEKDTRVYNVQNPTLTYVPPEGVPTGTAVIICPGGGYLRLAMTNEGEGAARVLAPLGVSTFILKYRLKEYGFPAPLQDVLRAVRLLRSRAAEFGIEPNRIGVFGASAGGHLAAMAETMFDAPEGRTGAPLDRTSARPDFAALLYPVITMKDPFVNRGSRDNLIGSKPPAALVDRLSLESQVTRDTPPTFLVHTTQDSSVPLENSLMFFQALRAAGVPAELHIFERGTHGFGFSTGLGPTSDWPRRLEDWMRSHGWLSHSGK